MTGLKFNRRKPTDSWLLNNNDQQISFFDDSSEFNSVLHGQEGEQRNRLVSKNIINILQPNHFLPLTSDQKKLKLVEDMFYYR